MNEDVYIYIYIIKDKKLKTVRSVTRVSRLKRSSDYRSLMFTQHLYNYRIKTLILILIVYPAPI